MVSISRALKLAPLLKFFVNSGLSIIRTYLPQKDSELIQTANMIKEKGSLELVLKVKEINEKLSMTNE